MNTPLTLCSLGGAMLLLGGVALTNATASDTPRPAAPSASIEHADALSGAFEYVAETIGPSVVTIRSTREIEVPAMNGMPRFPFDSPFEEFFGLPRRAPQNEESPARKQIQRGEGSGVVVSADGFILTNNHVVEDATEVDVVFADASEYRAEIVGTDPKTDLAVLKIDAGGLTPAALGDSDTLRVGQWVVAAGNPFGLSSTITAGIVSATGRNRMGITDYEDFIQTDAAINRGNSGGPLVNLRGEVIGINTAILSRTGGSVGVGFAIPVNMAKDVMDELIADGRVVRGYLGVLIQDLSEGMAQSFGYDSTDGALVNELTPDGPAAQAGLQPGDIIIALDGTPVTAISKLRLEVAGIDPGTDVDVTVFRDGERRSFTVTIEELPTTEVAAVPSADGEDLNLGLKVQTLTPDVRRQLRLDGDVDGVVVAAVEPYSAAAEAGVSRGDVITHVQNTAVDDLRSFRNALKQYDLEDGVRLTLRRGDMRRFVFLQAD